MVLCSSITVYANGGPSNTLVDGDVTFLLSTKVSDVESCSEQLIYKLNDFVDETMFADITARYEMHNTGAENVKGLVAFVSNNSTTPLEIFFKNEPAEIIRTETLDWKKYTMGKHYVDNSRQVARHWGNFNNWKKPAYGILHSKR